MNALTAGACALATLVSFAGAAAAAPLSTASSGPSADNGLVSKTAAYVCIRDDRGWHYMRGKHRVVCRPARPRGTFWLWHCEGPRCGWWHKREHRWND